MAVNAKKLNGDVIFYNTEKYSLIVVDEKCAEEELPRKGITEDELWNKAMNLVKDGKAKLYKEKQLNMIADALREVILDRPLLWIQPPKSSPRSGKR